MSDKSFHDMKAQKDLYLARDAGQVKKCPTCGEDKTRVILCSACYKFLREENERLRQALARVYVVTLPGEDIEAFASLELATQHARDLCSCWDEGLDWSEVENFARREADGKLWTSTVETPDGVLRLESCEVRV